MKTVGLFCLFVLLCSAPFVYAQAPRPTLGVDVTAFYSEEPATDQLQGEVLALLQEELRQRGIPSQGDQQMTLLVDAVDIGAGEYRSIVLSMTKLMRLPEAVLDVGAREEAFYLSLPAMDLPPEGAAVRQHMSREWLSQYQHVVGQRLRVVPEDQLKEAVAAMADVLLKW